MFAEAVADLLQIEGVGTVGTDIFIGQLTSQDNNGLYLMNAPSSIPNEAIEIYDQYIDFWTRNQSMASGYSTLQAVQNVLHKRYNYVIGDYHVYISSNLGMIEDMDVDVQKRKLQKLSMRFIYQPAIV